jgi:hypothetical protein
VKIDRIFRSIILKSTGNNLICKFNIKPNKILVNPAFTIENWKGSDKAEVIVNGSKVNAKTAKEGNSLLVWFPASFNHEINILIRSVL